ncbi:flagellar protein FlgN [uncultured Propionivibrio sp.]|uniref:flagella synthesis protein FlgN n=1 Tax=uncultured Propionivibrio sp. TaxID=426737 RepID=UPI0029C0B6C3|nr:flagellar protein FlgN [uncultured Propionivibrio sp.]
MAVQSSPSSRLLQTLTSESELVSLFISLLEKEQASLVEGQTETLPQIAEEKGRAADRLTAVGDERNRLLAEEGLAGGPSGIEAWCARHPLEKSIVSKWAEVLDKARRAKDLNQLNGNLITLRMQHTARALEALRSASRPLDLYGPDGQSAGTGTARRIIDSA